MDCPICNRTFRDDLDTFCRRCGWQQGPEDEAQRASRLKIARERWDEILALRQIVAELQATCTQSTLGADPDEGSGGAGSFAEPLTGMEFVCVPGGRFAMGDVFASEDPDERPVHAVAVQGFCLGKFPVTQSQWQAVTGANPSAHRGPDRPVDSVSWEDCQRFLEVFRARSGLFVRFPTEAEWEYAARSCGGAEKWSGTSRADEVGAFAWFVGNSGGASQPVGLKRPNRLGLHDMSGNVWEWCQDWYGESYYEHSPEQDPPGAAQGARRVARGGSWAEDREYLVTVWRGALQPDFRLKTHGLRVAISRAAARALIERGSEA
ncbi:MAG: SUMF1/EgtB/PvdO family nonheme iron enzyme [Proteobacteria bacterium]|nr:SUMF1/EgtB/PvdO family nonheme iron enzyme [Pseudomonadota bacterium]